MSSRLQRARPQMIGPSTWRAIACTASKSPGRGDGETGLDDVDAKVAQGVGHLKLFGQVHAGAGRLFAVAQGGVEDQDAAVIGHGESSIERKSPGTRRPGAVVSKREQDAG